MSAHSPFGIALELVEGVAKKATVALQRFVYQHLTKCTK